MKGSYNGDLLESAVPFLAHLNVLNFVGQKSSFRTSQYEEVTARLHASSLEKAKDVKPSQ